MIKKLSKINVWQQYKRSDAIVNYFAFLRDYIQENYNDLFFKYNKDTKQIELGEYAKEFSINQAQTEYLQYYLESIYNMKRPHYLVDRTYYDSGLKYDSFYKYDEDGTAELVPIYLLKKIFTFIYNLKYTHWSIPNLAGMLADFCEVNITEVRIEIDTSRLKYFKVYLPTNRYSQDFRIIYNTYRNILNMPIGFNMEINLIDEV